MITHDDSITSRIWQWEKCLEDKRKNEKEIKRRTHQSHKEVR